MIISFSITPHRVDDVQNLKERLPSGPMSCHEDCCRVRFFCQHFSKTSLKCYVGSYMLSSRFCGLFWIPKLFQLRLVFSLLHGPTLMCRLLAVALERAIVTVAHKTSSKWNPHINWVVLLQLGLRKSRNVVVAPAEPVRNLQGPTLTCIE